jgi:hypothetical protein
VWMHHKSQWLASCYRKRMLQKEILCVWNKRSWEWFWNSFQLKIKYWLQWQADTKNFVYLYKRQDLANEILCSTINKLLWTRLGQTHIAGKGWHEVHTYWTFLPQESSPPTLIVREPKWEVPGIWARVN